MQSCEEQGDREEVQGKPHSTQDGLITSGDESGWGSEGGCCLKDPNFVAESEAEDGGTKKDGLTVWAAEYCLGKLDPTRAPARGLT